MGSKGKQVVFQSILPILMRWDCEREEAESDGGFSRERLPRRSGDGAALARKMRPNCGRNSFDCHFLACTPCIQPRSAWTLQFETGRSVAQPTNGLILRRPPLHYQVGYTRIPCPPSWEPRPWRWRPTCCSAPSPFPSSRAGFHPPHPRTSRRKSSLVLSASPFGVDTPVRDLQNCVCVLMRAQGLSVQFPVARSASTDYAWLV